MALTEEQNEQITKNRERALELQKKRKEEQQEQVVKKRRLEEKDDDDGMVLEDFEINATPLVTKKEAMSVYCLPQGTLDVCEFVEKENPRKKGWTPMKLFSRSEIRRRARNRFGGLEGLVEERKKREMNRLKRDLEETKNVFSAKTDK